MRSRSVGPVRGTWWTAAQRSEIVQQVRAARDHRAHDGGALPPWVQPSTVGGLIDTDGSLSAAAVDAVWRITNHPGTLTQDWYESIIERGVDPLAYVELVASLLRPTASTASPTVWSFPVSLSTSLSTAPPPSKARRPKSCITGVPTAEIHSPT